MELGELINASRLLSADTQQLIDIFLRQAKLFKQVQINDSSSRTSHRKLVLQSKLAEQFALRAIVLDLSCYFGDNNTDINLNAEDDIDLLHQAAVVLIEKFNKEQGETGQSDEGKAMLLKPLLEALGSLTTFSPTVAKLLKFDQANAEKPESAPEEEKENKTDSSKKKVRSRPKKVSLDVQLSKTVPVSPVLDKADVSKIPKPAPTATPPPSPVNQISSPPPVLSPALLPSTQSNPQPHSSVPLPISKRVGPRTVNPLNLSLIASPPPQQESANADVKPIIKEVWTHRDRLPENQADSHCFICRKSNPDSQCGKRFSNSTRCRTRFHLDCLKDYNAGDFDAEYLHDSFGSYVCPLHHCNVCWFERLKTSAVSGDLIQCKCCYRSFHEICQPAGFFIEKRVSVPQAESSGKVIQTRIDMTVCHSHAKDKDVLDKLKHNKQATHLPFCSECEEKGQKSKGDVLINCSECIRSYHPNCKRLSVKAIGGLRFSGDDRVCEACILGENIRPNQTIIAKYANSFYPGMVAPLAKYPAHCAVADKFGSRLGDAGFVAVEWSGCQNLFSLVPSRFIVPMFEGSFDLVGKRMTDKDIRLAWEKMDSNIIVPRPHMLNAYELNRHKEIKTSFYQSEDVKPKGRLIPEEDMLCECVESSGDGQGRCGENCSNRTISQQECPKTCEQKLGGCNNRTLSRSEVCKKVVVFKTEKKGIGVEAVEDIKKDEFIAEYAGEIISEAEFQRRSNESAAKRNDEEKHYIMVLREPKRYIDAKYYGNIARFINHSCEPNCRVEEITIAVDSKKKGKSALCTLDSRVAIFAKRNIQKGEELSFDYDMDELSEGTPLPPCYCGASSCNGKLGKTKQEKLERRLKEEKKQQKVVREENSKPKKTGRKRKAPVSDSADEIKKELKNEGKKVETRGRKRKNIIVANDVPVTVDASWPKMPISLPLPVLITVQKDAIVLPSAGSPTAPPPVARFSPFKMMAGRRKSSSRSPRKPITPVPVVNAVSNDLQNHAKIHLLQPSADGKRQRRSRRAFSPSPERPKPQAVSA